jgi:hypothetical protein
MWTLRIVVAALGGALVISAVTMIACSSADSAAPAVEASALETSTETSAPTDGTPSVDSAMSSDIADSPGTTYSPDDLTQFQYSWYGTGISGDFAINRDCGVVAKGHLNFFYGGPDANGVAPAAECAAFKSLAVSPPMLDAMGRKRTMVCTDDYPSITITLTDGGKLKSVGEQCTTDEPYKTLLPKMDALRKSVTTDAGDGG